MQWEEFSVQVMGKFKIHPSHCQGRNFEAQRQKVNSWIWGSSFLSPLDSNRQTASSVFRKIMSDQRAPAPRRPVLTANTYLFSTSAGGTAYNELGPPDALQTPGGPGGPRAGGAGGTRGSTAE